MKNICLSKGMVALVDDEDSEWLSKWKWLLWRKPGHKDYAYRWVKNKDGRRVQLFMHRQILGKEVGQHTDHKDGNGLNNQRFNLRPATASQNLANRGRQRDNTSGYKGVTWNKKIRKWVAQIKYRGKVMHIGVFGDPREAASHYDQSAIKHFESFALTNRALGLL